MIIKILSFWLAEVRYFWLQHNYVKSDVVLTLSHSRLAMLFPTQKWALVRKLEEVHVVCPHPSSSRLVGVVTDNRDSGTIHCYCFLTKRGSTVSLLQHVYMYVGVKHMYVCRC